MLIKKRNFIIIFIIISLCVFLGYFFLFTTAGSNFIVKAVISKYLGFVDITFKRSDGSLSKMLNFYDVKIKNLRTLPSGSVINIQSFSIGFVGLKIKNLRAEFYNGRLKLPESEPLIFYGNYKNSGFDINTYSKNLNLRAFFDLFVESSTLKTISGQITDLDIYIKGGILNPHLTGVFHIDNFFRNGFMMYDCPASFEIKLRDIKDNPKIFGEIVLKNGTISGPGTAVIRLQESKMIFSEDPKRPSLYLKGNSIIEGTRIEIILKGMIDKPDLHLTSEPPMPQERLLLMLATGKSWEGFETFLFQRQIAPDLAKDFVDYFVFSGSGDKLSQSFGIKDISLTFEKEKKGFGVTRVMSEKVDANYAVEQSKTIEGQTTITQKVGGEYKITEHISIGAEKEFKEAPNAEPALNTSQPNDKAFLRYRKKF